MPRDVAAAALLLHEAFLAAASIPFTVPFDTARYNSGPLEAISDDRTTGAVMYWRTDTDNLHVGLAANAPWVGLGMNVKGPGMPGADIVVCQEMNQGTITAADYFSTRYGTPELDTVQDWETVAGGRVNPTPRTPPPNACPSSWTWSGSSCFKVFSDERNWRSAKSQCEARGAQLAKISNQYENQLVRSLASSGNSKIWIGANSLGRSLGDPVWADGSALAYSNWQVYHPRTTGNDSPHCVFMGYLGSGDLKWYSGACAWRAVRYACSKPAAPGTPRVSSAEMLRTSNLAPITWCEIKRSRLTCDSQEDTQADDLQVMIYGLLAWGQSWATSLSYHGNSQRRIIPFSFAQPAPAALPSDVASFKLTAPDHTVSAASGSYACSYHRLPIANAANTKYHIINYKVILGGPSVTAGLFHHMDVMACQQAVPGIADGQSAPCEVLMGACNAILMNGGYGPSGTDLPPDAGIPIGKGNTRYVVLSRHFYNPANKRGVLDRGSAYRLTYTRALRANDMSQITLGTQHISVPPNTFGHTVSAHCSPHCTRRLGKVRVRSVSFHMHGHGSRARVRVIRDGVELEPLADIDPWDQSQATRSVNRELLPGDTLFLDCVFDNGLNKVLGYGDNIDDEMCFAFVVVLGQSRISSCLDFPIGLPGSPPQTCNGWTHLPQCNWALSRSYCEDFTDPSAPTVFLTDSERVATFRPYAAPRNDLPCQGASGTPVQVPAIAGHCRHQGNNTGWQDCGMGPDVDFRVSWSTDCSRKRVTFDLEARLNGAGWFALGLHSAGTAAAKVDLIPTRMTRADIVQISPNGGRMRDAVGIGYTAPRAKASPVATLVSTQSAQGRWKASFSRPFTSSEGVSFTEDGFVWMMCAFRRGTNDLDVKHTSANAVSKTRISLFGGVAESTRYVALGPSPTPSRTPAAIPEATLRLTVAGIDFAQLSANAALVQSFHGAVKAAIASFFTGITANMVSLVLSAGSVLVDGTVTGAASSASAISNMRTSLQSDSSRNAFSQTVAEKVRAIPMISTVQNGNIAVNGVAASRADTLVSGTVSTSRCSASRATFVLMAVVAHLAATLRGAA